MEPLVYPRILNTKGANAIVIGLGVIKNTTKVPHYSATLSMVYFEFLILGRLRHTHYGALSCYLG